MNFRLWLLDIWHLAGLQGDNPESSPKQQGETKNRQAAKSKSKHLLAPLGFRNKNSASQCCSASLSHYIDSHQPVQSDFRHFCGTNEKRPASDLESAFSARMFKICWHWASLEDIWTARQYSAGCCRLLRAAWPKFKGEFMLSQPLFCLIFSCSTTSSIF